MKKLSIFLLLLGASIPLPAQDLRIVNAASLAPVSIAPGSIVTIFGSKLAPHVAVTDSAQSPATTLGGVTVTVGGTPAALFYVSPAQINAVVSSTTPAGVQTVTVTSGGASQTGTVTISTDAPPGLFSLFGTGTRDGAILDAITFAGGAFRTRTVQSSTFLAIYATGVSTAAAPIVTIGGVPVQVTYYGAAPCCAGLQQINVQLSDSLSGAGRVPVVLSSNGQTSNTVQVVLLPAGKSSDKGSGTKRSREISGLAYVPNSSTLLSLDENDDVVRVVDVSSKKVTRIIALAEGAAPSGIAVNSTGTLAVVAESGRKAAAVINLSTSAVTEIAAGLAPVSVAIGGHQAVVVNADDDTVSVMDLTANTLQKTITVGRGPSRVALNNGAAYVTNENDGTVSVIDLATLSVTKTLPLGADVRPEAIAIIPGTSMAFIAVPGAGAEGQAILLNVATGSTTSLSANPDRSGGATDVAVYNSKVYFANQTGGSVSVLPIDPATGAAAGDITTIKVDLGARALAIDTKDNLLAVSNEGSGTLVLVDLSTNKVVDRISAVQTGLAGDDGDDDHSDRSAAANNPHGGMTADQ